jgi:hypothetical protein
VDRFRERPYGMKFDLGIDDAFIPPVSSGTDPYDLEPGGRGDLLRIETPLAQAGRTAAERSSER